MILLLNPEAVIVEMMIALRARVSVQLEVPVEWVDVRLVRDKRFLKAATMHPEVTVNSPSSTDPTTSQLRADLEKAAKPLRFFTLTEAQIQAELQNLVTLVRNEINLRIAGLDK